ncbi:MAG: methyltransferase domain-containing protein [Caldilineaceae bacterium]|nr:methyltransferase domain-containing protein [Caldilineaceae bacterium]
MRGAKVLAETIDLATVDFLLSPVGRETLAKLHKADLSEAYTLAHLQSLRKQFTAGQAGALLSMARLRQRAATKFPQAAELFFTAEALEQATAWPIAKHRAAWLGAQAPPGALLDLGCGIGGDLLALAQHRPVIALEWDPVRLRLAAANVAALGLARQVQFIQADWTNLLAAQTLPNAAAAFADPARRVDGRRVFHVEAMQPPLSQLLRLQQTIPHLGVKTMPGIEDGEIPAQAGVEFISHEGVCKEAILWFGALVKHKRWASVYTEEAWQSLPGDEQSAPPVGPLAAGFYLHEPDPALIRAGAFGELCHRLQAHLFDPQIAYLVSPVAKTDPLVQSFMIQEVHPFALKLLNQRLQALGYHTVELKKRGVPFQPEELRPRLKLPTTGKPGVVIFSRRGNERLMLLGERVA